MNVIYEYMNVIIECMISEDSTGIFHKWPWRLSLVTTSDSLLHWTHLSDLHGIDCAQDTNEAWDAERTRCLDPFITACSSSYFLFPSCFLDHYVGSLSSQKRHKESQGVVASKKLKESHKNLHPKKNHKTGMYVFWCRILINRTFL